MYTLMYITSIDNLHINLLATMFTAYTVVHAMRNSSGSIVDRMLSTVILK